MDAGFQDTWKEISAIKEEMRELRQELRDVEQRLSEAIRQRYVDLRQRVERLQNSINAIDKRFEWQDTEIANLKKALRELEHKIDPPLAA